MLTPPQNPMDMQKLMAMLMPQLQMQQMAQQGQGQPQGQDPSMMGSGHNGTTMHPTGAGVYGRSVFAGPQGQSAISSPQNPNPWNFPGGQ